MAGINNGHRGSLDSPRGNFEAIPSGNQSTPLGSPMKHHRSRGSKAKPVISLVLVVIALGLVYLQQSAFMNAVRLSGASLLAQADPNLKSRLEAIAQAGQYIKCSATGLQGQSMDDFSPSKEVLARLDRLPSTSGKIKGNKFVELLIEDAPCWGVSSCCQTNTYIRPNKKEDVKAFKSLYEDHDLSLFYAIFQEFSPLYILEAGAGAGFTSQLFKLIWPRAVLVSLESDPANFETMVMNTRETDGVHAVHGGLWPYQATLRQRSKKGSFLLQESKVDHSFRTHDGILGLSVNNLLEMFDIPAFDFVYLDVEGSEAVIFSGAADLRWLSNAKVIAIKMHSKLGKYFGIEKKLVTHVSAAFSGRNFHVVTDESHVILISGEMMQKIPGVVGQEQEQVETEEEEESSDGDGAGESKEEAEEKNMGGFRDRFHNFLGLSQQCLSFMQNTAHRDDSKNLYSRLRRNESTNKLRRNPSSGLLRSSGSSSDEYQNGNSSSTSSLKRKISPRRVINGIRAARPASRRELLLLVVVFICFLQMAWMRQAQSNSLLVWVRDNFDKPDPGQPPALHAYLPATEVLKSSPDQCAQALGINKVALMFLTTGDLYHEQTWRLWFKSAADVIPAQSMATSICQAEGASARLMDATAACRPGPNANQTNNIIAQQHIFSVYIHAPPSFRGYDHESLWSGKLVQHRVKASWGSHTLVEATRHLLWEAFKDPLNTRFLLLSESDIPLYDPLTLWQQLQSETKSRLDTCKHQETSPWRWDPRMETANLRFHHWRKSPQWMSMTRDHVSLVLADEEVYRKFERHCWSSWDDKHGRWHRDCFSDEHYFATLLAAEGRDDEGVCAARGVSYTEWEGNAAHPKEFGPHVVDAELFKRARSAPLSAMHEPTAPCDWAAAQQAALSLYVSKDQALGAQSVDLCGRMWRDPPSFKAKMPETCFLTARKFPYTSRNRVQSVFLQCGNGVGLLREDVCLAEGGTRCGTVWGRVKGLFSRDPC